MNSPDSAEIAFPWSKMVVLAPRIVVGLFGVIAFLWGALGFRVIWVTDDIVALQRSDSTITAQVRANHQEFLDFKEAMEAGARNLNQKVDVILLFSCLNASPEQIRSMRMPCRQLFDSYDIPLNARPR